MVPDKTIELDVEMGSGLTLPSGKVACIRCTAVVTPPILNVRFNEVDDPAIKSVKPTVYLALKDEEGCEDEDGYDTLDAADKLAVDKAAEASVHRFMEDMEVEDPRDYIDYDDEGD
jgi:hypothetical protein